ncbi:SAM-dependent methyltransferase [Streptomyces sp. NPDC003233]
MPRGSPAAQPSRRPRNTHTRTGGCVTAATAPGGVMLPLGRARWSKDIADSLELVEPGVVSVTQWRPEPGSPTPEIIAEHGGLARKP